MIYKKITTSITGLFIIILLVRCTAPEAQVQVLRVPDNGIQPVVQTDGDGTIHMIYFKGDPKAGDVFYRKKEVGQEKFSEPVRVNSQPGSVIAIGTVRGARMSVTKGDNVHVAWMGSSKAKPRGPGGAAPMLYTRLNETGDAFEEQRNVMQFATGLDGGGTVAAGDNGKVYVVWHANPEKTGEEGRRVWVAKSVDGGKTFAKEVAVSNPKIGACGCCGITATVDYSGSLAVLYRAATHLVGRDMYLLTSSGPKMVFNEQLLEPWKVNVCPMSTSSAYSAFNTLSVAWETDGQVAFTSLKKSDRTISTITKAPGDNRTRKHPAVAHNARGETILVWTEGMGWDRGGSLHWQVFNQKMESTSQKGHANDVPVWSRPAVITDENGNFIIFY